MQQFAQQGSSQWQFYQKELIGREQPEEEAEEVGAIIRKGTIFWGAAGKNSWDGTLVTLKRKTTHIPICFSEESEVYFYNNRGEYEKDWKTFKTRIQDILKRWTSYANLEFDFKNSCAEINNKNYSVTIKLQSGEDYLGLAESIGVDNENNMRLGNKDGVTELNIDTKGIFSQYTWLHEMGHVLGFMHEHAHEDSTCAHSIKAVLERYLANKYDVGYIKHFAYDDRSIMNYCNSGSRVAETLDREVYLSSTDHRATMMVYGVKPNFSGVLRDINNKYKYFINGQYQKDFSSDCRINQEGHLTGTPMLEPKELAKIDKPICIQKGNTLEAITYNNNPYTGVFHYKINGINKEFYVKEGKYSTDYTGEAYDVKGHLYSVIGEDIYPGQYTGISTINGSMFPVINGTLDREFTGVLENDGSSYGFVNGESILPYKPSRYKDNEWLALQDRTGKYHAFKFGMHQKNYENINCKGSSIEIYFSPRLYIPTENRYTCFPKEDGTERPFIQNKNDENLGLPINGIRMDLFHDKEPLLLVNGFHRPSYTGVVDEVNYYNGIPAAGEVNGIKYAKNGKPLTGFYKNKFFKNGMLFTGLFEEKYYKDGNFQINYQGLVEIGNTNFYVNNGELAKGFNVYQGKLYQNGERANGFNVYQGKLYQNGELATGFNVYQDKLYQNGELANGFNVYQDKLYQNGELATGFNVYQDKLYQNGERANGFNVYQGKLYQNGERAKGFNVYQDKLYQNGELANGFNVYQDKLYQNGELATGFNVYQDKLYQNGERANGFNVYQDKLYQNGELATGFYGLYQSKFYLGGELAKGFNVYQGKLYQNGERANGFNFYQDKLYQNGERAKGFNVYQDKLYQNGELANGFNVYQDKLYLNGELATGFNVYQDKLYQNGERANGFNVYQGKLYQNGERAKGFNVYQDKLYQNGELANGFNVYQDKLYQNGELATDFNVYQDKLYQNGERANGFNVYQDELYLNGELDKGIIVYRDYLYISGSRLSFYEHFKYEDWNYFIYDGVLYTNLGSIYNGNALACNSSQTGPVKCVWADSYYTDGNVYKYHTNNNKNDTAKTGFEGDVYYQRDIRYAGNYCKNGKPYNNFKQVTDSSKCQSDWGSDKEDGPGWYSSLSRPQKSWWWFSWW
jgi:hypothetical protein